VTETTEKFIRVFEELKKEVNKRAHDADSRSFEIGKAAQKDRGVARYQEFLRYVRDIRNPLQHPKHKSPGHAAHISSTFLAEVEGILTYLRNPPNANSVGVSRKDMKSAQLTDQLGDLADEMKQTGFSHLPILDEKDVLIGVFNEAAIFDYLWHVDEQIVSRSMTVEEVLPHCRLDAPHTETFRFVAPNTPVDDLMELFRAIETPLTRVGAVFVTLSGKPDKPIQRLITPWDVMSSDKHPDRGL
jgi:predicted transcriptional regulator